jgi:hypothetical protein
MPTTYPTTTLRDEALAQRAYRLETAMRRKRRLSWYRKALIWLQEIKELWFPSPTPERSYCSPPLIDEKMSAYLKRTFKRKG